MFISEKNPDYQGCENQRWVPVLRRITQVLHRARDDAGWASFILVLPAFLPFRRAARQ
jgi:hypothetical protein